jgi:hypothetical protein
MQNRLNLGCGKHLFPGYINVDKFGQPDLIHDLEVFPWPWHDNSCQEIVMNHVLEHLGETTNIFLNIIKELYRICIPDALIKITVPHPRHDNFIGDPTHKRAITIEGLSLFSKKLNQWWIEEVYANSSLGLYLDVDFEIISSNIVPDEPWRTRLLEKEITQDDFLKASKQFNNVIKELSIILKVIK